MEPTETVRLSLVEVKKFLTGIIKQRYSFTKDTLKITKDSRTGYLCIDYVDGPDKMEMTILVEPYCRERGFGAKPANWFDESRQCSVESEFRLTVHRSLSQEFITRCATIASLQQGKALPKIVEVKYLSVYGTIVTWEMDTHDEDLQKEHAMLCKKSEGEVNQLLSHAKEQHGDLVALSDKEQSERALKEAQERTASARRLERTREAVLFRLKVFQSLEMGEFSEGARQDLMTIEKKIKSFASPLIDPVVCHFCCACVERMEVHEFDRLYTCQACALQEGTPQDAELPTNDLTVIPEEIVPRVGIQPLDPVEWIKDPAPEEYQFIPLRNGMYLAKNGKYAPVLTRDLMHDCRLCYWWLWVPDWDARSRDDVSNALYNAGWRRGYGRKQWYHRDQFAQVPDIIIDVFGGYIDGGYCDYRSHRGERLRTYADKVESQAEQEAEWSEAIVAQYMATGCFVTTYRSSRKLSKLKARAERKAQEARRLDQWVYELRRRANASESHQHRMSSTGMLERRIETVSTDRRKMLKRFHEYVEDISARLHANNPNASIEAVITYYEESYEPKLEVMDEELALLRLTIADREGGLPAPAQPLPQDIPTVPDRDFSIGDVVEVNVGENRTDVFPTPSEVGYLFLNHPDLPRISQDTKLILEPEGGTGALIDQINLYLEEQGIGADIHTYELVWDLNKHLQTKKCTVLGFDFLDREDAAIYDAVVMNPPFSKWLDHVLKAFRQLKKGGILLAILPPSWIATRGNRAQAFIRLVEMHGTSVSLPHGLFLTSGTNVAVSFIGLVKPE